MIPYSTRATTSAGPRRYDHYAFDLVLFGAQVAVMAG